VVWDGHRDQRVGNPTAVMAVAMVAEATVAAAAGTMGMVGTLIVARPSKEGATPHQERGERTRKAAAVAAAVAILRLVMEVVEAMHPPRRTGTHRVGTRAVMVPLRPNGAATVAVTPHRRRVGRVEDGSRHNSNSIAPLQVGNGALHRVQSATTETYQCQCSFAFEERLL
jgi:hypothetical protein